MILGTRASQWAASLLTSARGYNSTPQIQALRREWAHRGVWLGHCLWPGVHGALA